MVSNLYFEIIIYSIILFLKLGFHDDGANELCIGCNYSCLTCTGGSASINCVTCLDSNHRTIFSSNQCPCDNRFYNIATTPLCDECHFSCLTCSSNTSITCLTCSGSDNRLLTTNTCNCIA